MADALPRSRPPVRRVLLGLMVAFVAGTIAGFRWCSFGTAFFVTGAALLSAGAFFAWLAPAVSARAGGTLLLLAACSAGAASAALSARESGRMREDFPGGRAVITGTALEDAEIRTARSGRPYARVRMRAGRAGGRRDFTIECLLFGSRLKRLPEYGERWEIAGAFKAGGNGQPGRRDVFTAMARDARFISRGHGSRLGRLCAAARRSAARRLELGIGDEPVVTGVLKALILGYQGGLDRRVRNVFADTGTLHIFAISGLHVVIIAGMLVFLLDAAGVQKAARVLVLGPVLVFYTIATGAAASAVRACIMAMLFWAGPLAGRKPDGPTALAGAALLILGFDPSQIRELGFILSFSAVAGLMALVPVLDRALPRLPGPDPLLPRDEQRAESLPRRIEKAVRPVLLVSAAAWLVSAPLMALFFGRLSLGTLPANLLVVPLSFLVLVAGCLSLALGLMHDFIAETFNAANLALVKSAVAIVEGIARLPGSCLEVEPPPPVWIASWYALLGAWCLVSRPPPASETTGNWNDGTVE